MSILSMVSCLVHQNSCLLQRTRLNCWSDSGSSKSSFVTVTGGSTKLFGFGFALATLASNAWKPVDKRLAVVQTEGSMDQQILGLNAKTISWLHTKNNNLFPLSPMVQHLKNNICHSGSKSCLSNLNGDVFNRFHIWGTLGIHLNESDDVFL